MRHTHATLLLSQNEHPKIVSERLGHAAIMLTFDTYAHVFSGMQRAVRSVRASTRASSGASRRRYGLSALASHLGVSERTLLRRLHEDKRFSAPESDRLYRLIDLYSQATDVLGSLEAGAKRV